MPETEIVQSESNNKAKLPDIIDDTPELSREDLFIRYLMLEGNVKQAALKAGYSNTYANSTIIYKFNSPRFIDKVRKAYNGNSVQLLSKLSLINTKVIERCVEDVDNVPKFERTLKHIRQSGGVEAQDHTGNQPMIQVANIKNLLLNVHDDR